MAASRPHFQRLERQGRRFTLELRANPGAGTLLFYPGTMVSPRQYRPLMEALHGAGFAVAGLHLEGHGVNPHGSGFTFASLLEDGLIAERWLHAQGLGPVAVCGHSQGGILAVAHAGASATLTAAFAICTVLPQMPEAIGLTRFAPLAGRRGGLERAIAALGRALPRLPLTLGCYLSLRRVLAGHGRLRVDRRGSRWSYPLGFLASLFTARVPSRLLCPFRLYNARNDALFTPELARAVFDELRAPEKELVWLGGGGHLAPMAPEYAGFIARDAASVCSGLGLPLRLGACGPETAARGSENRPKR
ncbi:MAG: alpha/beta fold hydrolase [Desulfovibrio sp.]|nr:alpha/beta fold hydrolase [Desulfovibrio sp.]